MIFRSGIIMAIRMADILIDSFVEVYAWCVADEETTHRPGTTDRVHIMHLYRVIKYVDQKGFFPRGVRIKDYKGNELTETFFIQQFLYMIIYMN